MKISTYSVSELGYSHIKENKDCQDYSLYYSAPDNSLFIVIVSDGHGGKTYCRSDKGSRFACEIAMEAIKEINLSDLLTGKSAQVPSRKQSSSPNEDTIPRFKDVYPKIKDIDQTFEHLFQYIYSQWLQKVETHWKDYPPTQEEIQLLGNNETVKAYGATLMAFVRTHNYWFGFHIGDGKCLACDEYRTWYEPILWDPDCFLNKTTSLCENEAYKKFRYSFSGKGDFPSAVMLGSDGIDDSWGDKLPLYYTSILEDISTEGIENAQASLKESLPNLSKNGSEDDVSVAWIVDEDAIAGVLPKLKEADKKKEDEILAVRNKQLEALLREKNEEQKVDKVKYNNHINFLNKSAEQAKNEIQQLKEKIEKLEKGYKLQLKDEVDKYNEYLNKIAKLFKKNPHDSTDMNNLESYILSLQSKNSELSNSLKNSEAKVLKQEAKIKALEQQEKDRKKSADAETNNLDNNISSLENESSELPKSVKNQETEITPLDQLVKGQEDFTENTDTNNFDKHLSPLENESRELSKSVKNPETEITALEQQVKGQEDFTENTATTDNQEEIETAGKEVEEKKKPIVEYGIIFLIIGMMLGIVITVIIMKLPNKSPIQKEKVVKDIKIEKTTQKDTTSRK